jgi:NADP-dependent 3-hydroxy acid dehydrogenase YdfG
MATTKPIAIIAGVGSGTGAALARRFAQSYPVVLLARNPSNFDHLADEINQSGGKAIGISTDVSSEESVKNAFFEDQRSLRRGAGCGSDFQRKYKAF